MQQIIEVFEDGGSIQTNDALDYDEYVNISKAHLPEHVVTKFHSVVNELDRNLNEFLTDSEKFGITSLFWGQPIKNLLAHLHTELALEEERHKEGEKHGVGSEKSGGSGRTIIPFGPKHDLVIACKRFMMRLFSEFGEGEK